MITKIVYRNSTGIVINIGDWDTQITEYDNPFTGAISTIVNNPIPTGTTTAIENVRQDSLGGWSISEY